MAVFKIRACDYTPALIQHLDEVVPKSENGKKGFFVIGNIPPDLQFRYLCTHHHQQVVEGVLKRLSIWYE